LIRVGSMGMGRSRLRLVALLAVEGGSIEGLRRIGECLHIDGEHPLTWLRSAPLEDAVAATAWAAALGVAAWLALTTVGYLVARITRLRRASALLCRATVPLVRRLVDRALAISLATSIAAGPALPALAAEPPPPVVFQIAEDGLPHPTAPVLEASSDLDRVIMILPPGVAGAGFAPRPAPNTAPAQEPAGPAPESRPPESESRHTVASGDNLWTIAAAHLRASSDHPPATGEVADYWRRVVAANESTLRSGDPNLIFPGEIVTLPRVEVSS